MSEKKKVYHIQEGFSKKGGIRKAPSPPKPKIKPGAQKPKATESTKIKK